jgi:conjugative transfer signal peptidase TraF
MKRRRVMVLGGIAAIGILGIAGLGFAGGFRINVTPSEPLGLWRIAVMDRPVKAGDLVFVCPPEMEIFRQAFERGYLRRGLCPGGFAPLIKTVAALPGQRVEIADDVVIDGRPLVRSTVHTGDGEGRPLDHFRGGVVPPGFLFLYSSFASSYDSRYFGPVPQAGILGFARPVFTFDP